jgi:hypothetical protein
MKVEQLSIFVENKSGRLAEVSDILAKRDQHPRPLLADTADFGILRLIVDDMERRTLLKDSGFTVGRNRSLPRKCLTGPAASGILIALQGKGDQCQYMYAFVQKSEEMPS